jgi:hypothetical protein
VFPAILSADFPQSEYQVLRRVFESLQLHTQHLPQILSYVQGTNKSAAEDVAGRADATDACAVLTRHVTRNVSWLLEEGGDIAAVAKRCRVDLGVTDLVVTSDVISVAEPSDLVLMSGFASHGVDLTFSTAYVPTSTSEKYPSERALFRRVRPAIFCLLADLVSKGHAVVLPRDVARGLLPAANTLPIHWVPKATDPLGRLIADASGGDFPPNGADKSVKVAAREIFGPIRLPREVEIAVFILTQRELFVHPVLSIDDIRGAFSRLFLSRSSAAQSALEIVLDDRTELAVILTSMFFGGTSCPYAWNVVSRVISVLLRAKALPNLIYVDDIMRMGELSNALSDGATTKTVICEVLSPGTSDAWAAGKANWGCDTATYIGWSWCVSTASVSCTPRAMVRFLSCLFRTDMETTITLVELQRLASLGSRISMVLTTLKPLSFVVYDSMSGLSWRRPDWKIDITPLLRAALDWWQVLIQRAWNLGVSWSTPLIRVAPQPPSFSLQFDGSLTGVGGVSPAIDTVFKPLTSIPPYAYRVVFPYKGMSSGEQNTSELIAITFGLASAARLKLTNVSILLVGDSRSALAWIDTRVKSIRAVKCYMLLEAIASNYGYTFADQHEWIPSKSNVIPDDLSRDLGVADIPALHGHVDNPLPPSWVEDALSFVDPLSDVDPSDGRVYVWYERALSLSKRIPD